MKSDLHNYLAFKERSQVSMKGPKATLSPQPHGYFDKRNNKSTLGTGYTRSSAIKHLFDSEYVKPQDNYRVSQESSVARSAVLKDALDRYEFQLKNDQETNSHNLFIHEARVKHDENEL